MSRAKGLSRNKVVNSCLGVVESCGSSTVEDSLIYGRALRTILPSPTTQKLTIDEAQNLADRLLSRGVSKLLS
jgi:hypothetical protein